MISKINFKKQANADTHHPSDCLNRENFLELLDKIVKTSIKKDKSKCDYGAIGIDGEWGCGKSWILQEFTKRHKDEYLIFHYNAWSNDYYKEPLVGILASMVSDINSCKNFELLLKRYGKELLNQLKHLSRVAIRVISNLDVNGIKPIKIIYKMYDFFKSTKKRSEIQFDDKNKYIGDAIRKISEALLSIKNLPIVLIVDDLDRCLPEYAIKVLERLHHLEMESSIVQMVAINKMNMSYGIAKVYGRFDLLNAADENSSNIIKFSDEYFKKLFSVYLPLGNSSINETGVTTLFNEDFIHSFKQFKIQNILAGGSIDIDIGYFENFYSRLFENVNIREQKRIIDMVQSCHKITMDELLINNNLSINFEYQHLIWEILVCVNIMITLSKKSLTKWFINITDIKAYTRNDTFSIGYSSLSTKDNFSITITNNFVKIFSKYKALDSDNILHLHMKRNEYQFDDNDSFVLAYYCICWPLAITMDATGILYKEIAEKIISEQNFLRLFQKNMRLLMS